MKNQRVILILLLFTNVSLATKKVSQNKHHYKPLQVSTLQEQFKQLKVAYDKAFFKEKIKKRHAEICLSKNISNFHPNSPVQ